MGGHEVSTGSGSDRVASSLRWAGVSIVTRSLPLPVLTSLLKLIGDNLEWILG